MRLTHNIRGRVPRIMRVARVQQVRDGRPGVDHGREAHPQVAIGVLRHAPAQGLAHHSEVSEGGQATPAMVVAQDHLDGALAECERNMLERRHAHVGAEG